ncbi:hypothetical protein M441DRAFT_346933 [Trichoderma asperellum CBS 433.97]|uniref:Secreted protein n=1 Tax=Trichoderma asperellum (strain ATCC 204424 / CBS 433.97 / NBRC 101777) TaxID=1042311 RepID=A0A2T3ZHR3_TRIA4|nr:hypothetical protein M441DRAFT_346933 [Trichoderma asperellum CBS 433.97]PTB44340.1 hypothetical protein M441DRAFT_346933 [Trichoderma asperellum CBS 433.97]
MLVFLFCLWWLKSDAETGLARAGCFVFQGLEDNPSYSCLSHASHSHSHRLPTTPEFQEKSRELPSRENWAVLRTWHAFILQSPHRMTFFDPAEGGKKNLRPIPEWTAHISEQDNPPRGAPLTS